MSDEYEYGPWVEVPEGGLVQLEGFPDGYKGHPTPRYRIATPKPKRELVVGKWYRRKGNWWSQVIAVSGDHVWMTRSGNPADGAIRWGAINLHPLIEWSTPPRDEAPE